MFDDACHPFASVVLDVLEKTFWRLGATQSSVTPKGGRGKSEGARQRRPSGGLLVPGIQEGTDGKNAPVFRRGLVKIPHGLISFVNVISNNRPGEVSLRVVVGFAAFFLYGTNIAPKFWISIENLSTISLRL